MEIKSNGYSFNLNPIYVGDKHLIFSGVREIDHKDIMVKLLNNEYPPEDDILRIKHEYEISKLFNNEEDIVHVYSLEQMGNNYGIIMENILMPRLNDRLEREKKLTISNFLDLSLSISKALSSIHQKNIIHKDINPSNILCSSDNKKIKIIDFGISVNLPKEHTQIVNPNVLEGTLTYLSPEQTGRMNRGIDYRTDFYSLGVLFYQMLTGTLPFCSKDPLELVHSHIAIIPISPIEKDPEIPAVISDIVMKLLAKKAENRYQNANGLIADLKNCQIQLAMTGKIDPFPLAEKDIFSCFLISEKIYGRENEVKTLLSSYENVAKGNVELMLITGYSGIGKTSLVHEIHKPIVAKRGYFISGKYDQFKHTIPYAAIADAFDKLVKQILSEPEQTIAIFRDKILAAVGAYGQMIVDVIPSLTAIIGKQPSVPDSESTERLNTFSHIFQKFIEALAIKEHPLVLFLDDLQWADLSSLKMLETLVTSPNLGYLFIIGSYRSNEVSISHPLTKTIEKIKEQQIQIKNIELGPISLEDTTKILIDTLHEDTNLTQPLSTLVYEKTKGNPFFIVQLLQSLHQSGEIYFDAETNKWLWNFDRISAKQITENVSDLMIDKIKELPDSIKMTLQYAACIGNHFNARLLGNIIKKDHEAVLADLQILLQEGYIIKIGQSYTANDYYFAHDRIQQAAYSVLDEAQKKQIHLELARSLLQQKHDSVFDIVNHYNHAIDIADEKKQIAELNLKASLIAKDAAAFPSALEYIEMALQCLDGLTWKNNYSFLFPIYEQVATCTYLCGQHERSEEFAAIALNHAHSLLDKLKITRIQVFSNVAQMKQIKAIDLSLKMLAKAHIRLPRHPKLYNVLYYILKTKLLLGNKRITSLLDNPTIQDETNKLILQLIGQTSPAAFQTEHNLFVILICTAVQFSMRFGNSKGSAIPYAGFGIILCSVLGDIDKGFQFGQLGLNVVEKLKDEASRTRVNFINEYFLRHWKEPLHENEDKTIDYFLSGVDHGDLESASYNISTFFHQRFQDGTPLKIILENMDKYKMLVKNYGQDTAYNYICIIHQATLNLCQPTEQPGLLVGDAYNETEMEQLLIKANVKTAISVTYTTKFMLLYLFNRLTEAQDILKLADKYIDVQACAFGVATHNFYKALLLLTLYPNLSGFKKLKQKKTIRSIMKKMAKWSRFCPKNEQHRYLLLQAEYSYHVENKWDEAGLLYDQAIVLANENKFLSDQALANELAAKFYFTRGYNKIASVYMKDARYCYQMWGAENKVLDLDKRYPTLFVHAPNAQRIIETTSLSSDNVSTSTTTISALLDWKTMQKSSLAISSTIILNKLLKRLMQLVIENAGAQKSYLLLKKKKNFFIMAEGNATDTEAKVLHSIPLNEEKLPLSIINYVINSQETLTLDNAVNSERFQHDIYVQKQQVKSVFCMPLMNQGKLTGVLYLENNLIDGAFTENRLQPLTLLSSQISMSINNANLYANTQKLNERLIILIQAYESFVPNDFLTLLNKKSIDNIQLGDNVQANMTVFFMDIRNFTTLSEEMTPQENFNFINGFLNIVAPIIRQYHGFVDKYIGDAVMALFPKKADDALDCAIEIQKTLIEYNKKNSSAAPIKTGIGINTGPLMLGIVGEKYRMNATVISDAVNIASRVEHLTKQYNTNILITEDTYNNLTNPAKYRVDKFSAVNIRGKKNKIVLYAVHDIHEGKDLDPPEACLPS